MIIKGTVVGLLILSPLVAIPVRADVLEIAPTGEAYWRSGPTLVVQQQFNRCRVSQPMPMVFRHLREIWSDMSQPIRASPL